MTSEFTSSSFCILSILTSGWERAFLIPKLGTGVVVPLLEVEPACCNFCFLRSSYEVACFIPVPSWITAGSSKGLYNNKNYEYLMIL